MATNTTLNVRIEEEIKVKASRILEASGLTASSAVRLFLLRVIEDEALPFDMHDLMQRHVGLFRPQIVAD